MTNPGQLVAIEIPLQVSEIFHSAAEVLAPPADLTVTEWAERERIISKESGSFGGRYHVSLTPYQRAMQDAIHAPGVKEIVFFLPSQMGKSTCMENIFGYFVDQDPCSVIWMWPTEKVAKEWSDDTLEPMIRDTPVLAAKFNDGSRKSSNKTLAKRFPGGWLSIIGANSAAGLRRRRARIIMADEIDGYTHSAGDEGDPIELVAARSETYWDKLRIEASTCTDKGASRIEARYEISNKQKYFVPCPHCTEAAGGRLDGFQLLIWKRLIFDKIPPHSGTVYPCVFCGVELTEHDKAWMVEHGEWRAERPEIVDIQGFWLNKLYSPFATWAELVGRFLNAVAEQRGGNNTVLKKFTNLDLGETWVETDEAVDRDGLVRRCEQYFTGQLPDGVIVVTAGVDVQEDRLEVEVVGWGRGEESWSIAWHRIEGDTSRLVGPPESPSVWQKLDAFLDQDLEHVKGVTLPIAATFIDSGFRANEVYSFTRSMERKRRIFPSKGMSDFYHPPLKKATESNRARVKMYPIGVSSIKKSMRDRLLVEHAGPGYMHFSMHHNDADYFKQLTCEVLKRDNKNGRPVRYWEKPAGARNEALDCRVYAYAAFLSLDEQPAKMLNLLDAKLKENIRKLQEQLARGQHPDQLQLIPADSAAAVEVASEGSAEPVIMPLSEGEQKPESIPTNENAVAAPPPTPVVENRPSSSESPEQNSSPPRRLKRSSWIRRY